MLPFREHLHAQRQLRISKNESVEVSDGGIATRHRIGTWPISQTNRRNHRNLRTSKDSKWLFAALTPSCDLKQYQVNQGAQKFDGDFLPLPLDEIREFPTTMDVIAIGLGTCVSLRVSVGRECR